SIVISLSDTSEKEIFVILKPGKKFLDKKSDTIQDMGVSFLSVVVLFYLKRKRPFLFNLFDNIH
ncbi:hypothetical protein, partial [Succinivibrio sp.]